jgi:hypothetical protein
LQILAEDFDCYAASFQRSRTLAAITAIILCQNGQMIDAPTPDSTAKWLLGLVFGSPSLVVSTYVVLNALWSWWTLGRGVVKSSAALMVRSHDVAVLRSLKTGQRFELS